ncbi:TonB-dependent receptor plug domain-containing protein [Neptunomonas phycophila]|uniref:TonB-dependent receptor plug domain-containing protein n=1 Tax=Neptunomonas phycophila TaxID=1572645 RepID=UPI0023F7BA58|nr:TonB-dependent receptor [Neptunomonas phycophila]
MLFSRHIRKSAGLFLFFASQSSLAADSLSLEQLKSMDIEELSSIEVGIASKIPTKVEETPAAVYVLTSEDIRRSGHSSVAEALRMVPGLNVGSVSGNSWAINSRGFQETFSNKFLVLLDGRSLYNQTFGGVYWDMNDIRTEDIERIEVIRGPGSAVWGANAMNGVINIITRSSFNAQGGEVSTTLGNQRNELSLRYGGELNTDTTYRVSGKVQSTEQNSPTQTSGLGFREKLAEDESSQGRLNFRTDTDFGKGSSLMLEAGVFRGKSEQRMFVAEENQITDPALYQQYRGLELYNILGLFQQGLIDTNEFTSLLLDENGDSSLGWDCLTSHCTYDIRDEQTYEGAHLLGKWRQVSGKEWYSIQAYVDYVERSEYQIKQRALSLDIDLEHGWKSDLGDFAIGAGFRSTDDSIKTNRSFTPVLQLNPSNSRNNIVNLFIQNSYQLTDDIRILSGLGYEYSSQTGVQWQPTIRGLWSVTPDTQLWSAMSFSSRTASRIETGAIANSAYSVETNDDHAEEQLSSLELGLRHSFTNNLSIDLSAYKYWYRNLTSLVILRAFDPIASTPGELTFGNDAAVDAYGAELAVDGQVVPSWKLQASYSWISQNEKRLASNIESIISTKKSAEQQWSLRSYWDVTEDVELDVSLYYVSDIGESGSQILLGNEHSIDSYLRTDIRLGWQLSPQAEISLIGQNLFDSTHEEFFSSPINVGGVSENTDVKRSVSAKFTLRF